MEKILNKATAFFAIVFASALLISNASAVTAVFQIQAAEITEISSGATGTVSDFDESSITSDVTLHRINDTVKYKLTLKNTDSIAYTIESISDDNTNSYISYAYDDHTDEVVAAGSTFDLLVTATYTTSITEANERSQTPNVNILIKLAGIPEPEVINISPNTNDDIALNIVILAASVTGLIVCAIVIFICRRKKGTKAVAIIVAAGSIIVLGAATAKAIDSIENTLGFNASFNLMDKVLVSYTNEDGSTVSVLTAYDEPASFTPPTKEGHHITGWTTADGQPFDVANTNLTEDTTITPTWVPNEYNFSFDANGGTGDAMESTTCYYGVECSLPSGTYTYEDHEFLSWNTAANGSGTEYTANANITLPDEAGDIVLYAQWKSLIFTISYDKDADDAVGTMASQENIRQGANVTLHASNFSRSGYGFLGWIDDDGNKYGPNETIKITSAPESGTFRLRANWLASSGYLQDFKCTKSLKVGYVKALTDKRDGQTYAIAKLADRSCWMIENLRLEKEGTYGTIAGTTTTMSSLSAYFDSGFVGLTDAIPIAKCSTPDQCSNSQWRASKLSYDNPTPTKRGDTVIYDFGGGENAWYKYPRYNNDNTVDRAENSGSGTITDENVYSYGNVYNFPAAAATVYGKPSSAGGNETTSICPKGWQLPGGTPESTERGEAYKLINTLSTSGVSPYKYPNNFVMSGTINWGHRGRGNFGSYTTKTRYDKTAVYVNYFYITKNGNMSITYTEMLIGKAVRCIIPEPLY